MFHVALFQPEIPPNTGNIIRLCANTGSQLHLIHPLGFQLTDRELKRAGLDYHEYAKVKEYANYSTFLQNVDPTRLFAFTTRASRCYSDVEFKNNDIFLFGPETRGLPKEILDNIPSSNRLRIPMLPHSRSLNLANSVSVIVYEAWRQQGFTTFSEPNCNELADNA